MDKSLLNIFIRIGHICNEVLPKSVCLSLLFTWNSMRSFKLDDGLLLAISKKKKRGPFAETLVCSMYQLFYIF